MSSFNKKKDDFVLLKDLYDEAKKKPLGRRSTNKLSNKRNIFSIIYLNQNLHKMGKTEATRVMSQLKIVR